MPTREKNEIKTETARPVNADMGPRSSPSLLWLLASISGALQIVIFPLPNWTFLCWIGLAPLLLALVKSGMQLEARRWPAFKRGFLLGFVCGIIYYAGSCYWMGVVMHNYGDLSLG